MKNFRIHNSIIALLCLGFFLLSGKTFACSKEISASVKILKFSCPKDQVKLIKNADCADDNCQNANKGCDCNGCKHNSCKCLSTTFTMALLSSGEIKQKHYFPRTDKDKFSFSQNFYSSDYSSIWLPPKIA